MCYIILSLFIVFIIGCSDSGTVVIEGQEISTSSSSLFIYTPPKSSSSSLQILRPGIELSVLQLIAPSSSNRYYEATFKNNTGTNYKTFSLDYYIKCNWTKTNSTSGDTLFYNSSTFALNAYETVTKDVGKVYLVTAATYKCSITLTTVRGTYVEPWLGTYTYP